MNKKLIISGVVLSVFALAIGYGIHGVFLRDEYLKLGSLYRAEADAKNYCMYLLIAHVLTGFSMAWIYRQGISPGVPFMQQGIRFGLAMACLITAPMYLICYAVQPLPEALVMKQIIFDSIGMVILGIVVAKLNA